MCIRAPRLDNMIPPGVGCCFLIKLTYYWSENLHKFISNKALISAAWFLPKFDKKQKLTIIIDFYQEKLSQNEDI